VITEIELKDQMFD